MTEKKLEEKEKKVGSAEASTVFTIADLEKQLKQREEIKSTIENKYYQLLGQLQLLVQQIDELKEKEKKSKGK